MSGSESGGIEPVLSRLAPAAGTPTKPATISFQLSREKYLVRRPKSPHGSAVMMSCRTCKPCQNMLIFHSAGGTVDGLRACMRTR